MCCHGKLKITGPLEVSVHLASLQALTKVIGNWARVKTWHANLMQKGVAFAFKKQEVAGKARKTKESARQTGCLLQEVKDIYGLRGAAVKYLSSKGWTDIRTMRSNAETCVNSHLEGR